MQEQLDALTAQLERAGVANHAAAAQARRMLGLGPAAIVTASEAELADEDEDVHVHEGDRLMRSLGFEIVSFSQKRRAKVTPGIPDRKFYHRRRRLTLWWEAKQESGRQRAAQREFQIMAEACGETYVLGKLEALKHWLVESGVAVREGDTFHPTPLPANEAPPPSLLRRLTMMTANSRPAPLQPGNAESPRRWWRYMRPGGPRRLQRLTCPLGHTFRERATFTESGFIRCEHFIEGERRECGHWIFVFAIRGGGCIVAEVTLDERTEMCELSTPAQMLEYLGIFDLEDPQGAQAAHPATRPPDRHHHRR